MHGSATWPPAYSPPPAADGSSAPTPPGVGFPPASWPSKGQLDYVRALVTALLLVLALPWLSWALLTRPSYVLKGAGQRHLNPA